MQTQGYDHSRAFLAGPGPMQSTVSDFWTMIWEKKSHTIVMLGQLEEDEEVIANKITNRLITGCFIRMFVLNTGQMKMKLVNLDHSQLNQFQKIYGVKTLSSAFLN